VSETRQNPTHLLDREVSAEYLRESSAHVAAEKKIAQAGTRSVVIFRIASEWLALPADIFQEASDEHTIRTLPHRKGGVLRGLVSVRGELLICVAFGILLGVADNPELGREGLKASRRLLVCNEKGGRFAFQVNEIYGTHRYHPSSLRAVPATLAKTETARYITGILPWKQTTVGLLDPELLLYTLNRNLA
jgi:chemotaxis-related protein WspD